MTKTNVLTWKIGGEAGGGQQVAGLIFAKACTRGGLFTFDSSEYPSRIRGGLVTYRLSISSKPVTAIYKPTQLLITLTKQAFNYCKPDIVKGGVILYDSDKFTPDKQALRRTTAYPLPLKTLAKEAGVPAIASNMIAIGASTALLKYDLKIVEKTISEVFLSKGHKVIELNLKAVRMGYEYAQNNLKPEQFPFTLKKSDSKKKPKILVTANDTIALGAVAANCKYFVAYPMTPASSILHNLSAWARRSGMVVFQPEDEISAIHMTIGGGYAGVRSMTATSGGGFALMNEGFALGGITETPFVLVESMRPGPATGLPTWTGQTDLAFLCRAGHGEFIRIVLTPGDAVEAFELTGTAFNLSEKFQVPVVILLDKHISEGHQSIDPLVNNFEIDRGKLLTQAELSKIKKYKRYLDLKSGVSPRAIPSQKGGIHIANSDEHDQYGFSVEGFQADEAIKQVDKRFRKLPAIQKALPKPKMYGPKKAKLTLMGWGSTKGPVLEALKELPHVNYLHVTAAWPLSEDTMKRAVVGVKKLVAIENNATAQFAQLLRGQTGIQVDKKLLKYDGQQFFPEGIISSVKRLIK
ncbi:2-oxoacid:acceptor oxidoreductase subunit alpha [Patescibacteria group bacterium]|nr:2-oxoacid:acceptor oxidoreductase subunit alpha [Patescibacteria group bacterium]MBU1890466.1 2-oxoacid:acceptor oxidoreductase subunit alpha [Patescibacteria group bacterium]